MRTRSGVRLAGGFLRLAAGALAGLGGATVAWAQTQLPAPQPAPAAQLAKPLEPPETPGSSQASTNVGFATARVVRQPAPAAQPASPASPTESVSPSQVFPDGGFPPSRPAPEGAIPGPGAQPGLGGLYTPIQRAGAGYRPVSDYTPPGRLYRDPQPGVGAPLYQALPTLAPEQIPTDLERDKFVTRGLFPGTYLIPGTNTSFKLYGFARLDGIFDFDPIGGTDSFVTAQIPVPQGRGQNFG